MDGALLLIAANESCPQPQTSEHLAALELMGQEHIIILQNKVDLIREQAAKEQMEEIRKFVDCESRRFRFVFGFRFEVELELVGRRGARASGFLSLDMESRIASR